MCSRPFACVKAIGYQAHIDAEMTAKAASLRNKLEGFSV